MQSSNIFIALILTLSSLDLPIWSGIYPDAVNEFEKSFSRTYIKPKRLCFVKLDSSGIEYTTEQTFFENLAKFATESSCVQAESCQSTDTRKWMRNHVLRI